MIKGAVDKSVGSDDWMRRVNEWKRKPFQWLLESYLSLCISEFRIHAAPNGNTPKLKRHVKPHNQFEFINKKKYAVGAYSPIGNRIIQFIYVIVKFPAKKNTPKISAKTNQNEKYAHSSHVRLFINEIAVYALLSYDLMTNICFSFHHFTFPVRTLWIHVGTHFAIYITSYTCCW